MPGANTHSLVTTIARLHKVVLQDYKAASDCCYVRPVASLSPGQEHPISRVCWEGLDPGGMWVPSGSRVVGSMGLVVWPFRWEQKHLVCVSVVGAPKRALLSLVPRTQFPPFRAVPLTAFVIPW